jgi:hypothetical protein
MRAQAVLYFVDVGADAREGLGIVGQRQEVVKKPAVMGRPREMLGEQPRPVAIDETPQAREMRAIEAAGRADRQADTMKRKRIAGADLAEHVVRRPALAHVVFGVNLEEIDSMGAGQYVVGMLMLEPDPDAIDGEQ